MASPALKSPRLRRLSALISRSRDTRQALLKSARNSRNRKRQSRLSPRNIRRPSNFVWHRNFSAQLVSSWDLLVAICNRVHCGKPAKMWDRTCSRTCVRMCVCIFQAIHRFDHCHMHDAHPVFVGGMEDLSTQQTCSQFTSEIADSMLLPDMGRWQLKKKRSG